MPYLSHGVLGTASPPSLERTLEGGSITPKHGSGYPGPSPEGGVSHPHFRLILG